MNRDKIIRRRAFTALDQLGMAVVRSPIPVSLDDIADAGVPEGRRPAVLDRMRQFQGLARGGESGRARALSNAAAKEWASEWGDEVISVDHSAEVERLTAIIGRL